MRAHSLSLSLSFSLSSDSSPGAGLLVKTKLAVGTKLVVAIPTAVPLLPRPPLLLPPTQPKLWHFGPIFGLAPSLTAASWSVASFCGCSLLNEIDLCLGCPGLVQLKPDELQNWPSGVYTSTDIKYTQCASHSHRILRIRSVQAIALAAFKLQLMLGYLASRL